MKNLKRINRNGLFIVVLTFLLVGFFPPVQAQVNTGVPVKNKLVPGQGNSTDLTSSIDEILGGQGFGADLMSGIQGYGLDVAAALAWKVADEAVKAVADMTVFAPIATEIMSAYEKLKANKLAGALNAVKEVQRDALSRQLKLGYQKYKINYGAWAAKARLTPGLKKSKTVDQANGETGILYQSYVGLMWEYDEVNEDSIVNATPGMGFHLFATAAALADHKDLDLKLALADKQYLDSTGSEVFAMSAYDRIRIRQEARAEASRRNMALLQMQQQVRARINVERSKIMDRDLGRYLNLNSQIH